MGGVDVVDDVDSDDDVLESNFQLGLVLDLISILVQEYA